MRKFIIFFIIFMVICFLAPNIFIIDVLIAKNKSQIHSNVFEYSGEKDISVKKNATKKIRLLLTEKNEVVELDFDDYIKGVLIGEVPITYELEALKAQAIVARTYTMYKLKNNPNVHEKADMCDNINCCQCYKTKEYAFKSWDDETENEIWSKLEMAVNGTKDKYITYSGEIISAFFHAHSGGQTESIEYVWGENKVPYLKSVAGNESYPYQDTKTFTMDEFIGLFKDKVKDISKERCEISIVDYTGSGRVNNIKINDTAIKATELRKITEIRSTNFRIEKTKDGQITFYTVGYGHGVGMSQEGANQMALDGYTCEEIIKHYYTGVEVYKCDSPFGAQGE